MMRKNEKGFVFVDVIVGMVILVTGMVAIAGLYSQLGKLNFVSNSSVQANNLAQAQMEAIKASAKTWAIGEATPPMPALKPAPAGFTVTQTCTPCTQPNSAITGLPNTTTNPQLVLNAVNNRFYDVVVAVNWTENNQSMSTNFETLLEEN